MMLVIMLIVWASVEYVMLWQLGHARRRVYRYAADMAARFDVTDPRGQAYSDMATVIALDGKAVPKQWAES